MFREWKTKYDLVDNKQDDTLEYSYQNTFLYDPTKNGPGLTGDEIVTIAHPLILGIALTINADRPEMLPFVDKVIKGVLPDQKSFLWTGRAMDILFNGIPLDCRSDDFEVAGACAEFSSGTHKNIQPVNETFYKFSLFSGVSNLFVIL